MLQEVGSDICDRGKDGCIIYQKWANGVTYSMDHPSLCDLLRRTKF